MKISRRHLHIAAGAVVALILAVWLWPRNVQPSNKDIQTMQTFTQPMTTRCVGRFVIDIPAQANEVHGQYGLRIASIQPIQKTSQLASETLRRLDHELAERAALQVNRKDVYGKLMPDVMAYQPTVNVRSIRYSTSDLEYNPKMDGYIVRPGGLFSFRTNANDESEVNEFNDFLVELEPTLSVRENSVIPTTPGLCIDDGFIAMDPKKGESATLSWELASHPDVRFILSMQSNDDKVRTGLLDRESETISYMGDLMRFVKTLRKRRFELMGMPAQEWSVEFTDTSKLELEIEIPGAPNDKAKPFIAMTMQVGGGNMKVKPSLSNGEAFALWDAVIQTLRLRPGAV